LAEIHLYPALVQGQGSKESLVSQIKLANQKNKQMYSSLVVAVARLKIYGVLMN
jgi:exonuclease VII large subunit